MQPEIEYEECPRIRYAMSILSDHKKEAMMVFINQLVANQEEENSRKPELRLV